MKKSIAIFSTKGGVGKTVFTLNLAGIYETLGKKVLIIDYDLTNGGIALSLNKEFNKTIHDYAYDIFANQKKSLKEYTTKYDEYIDFIASPKDPRLVSQIDNYAVISLINEASHNYDVILIDTNHVLTASNLVLLDGVDEILFLATNDPIDLKNLKNLLVIFKNNQKTNYKILLNDSYNPYKNYFSLYDIKNIIKANIDYTLTNNFFVKNIDQYIMNGEILTLQKDAPKVFDKDYANLLKLVVDYMEKDDNNGK